MFVHALTACVMASEKAADVSALSTQQNLALLNPEHTASVSIEVVCYHSTGCLGLCGMREHSRQRL